MFTPMHHVLDEDLPDPPISLPSKELLRVPHCLDGFLILGQFLREHLKDERLILGLSHVNDRELSSGKSLFNLPFIGPTICRYHSLKWRHLDSIILAFTDLEIVLSDGERFTSRLRSQIAAYSNL